MGERANERPSTPTKRTKTSSEPSSASTSRPARTRSRRNTFGCNLVNAGDYDVADKIGELSLGGPAIADRAGSDASDEATGRRSGDDVDFYGREALQRLRVFPVSATLGRVKDAFR
jgi:hypothetical protein